MQSHEDTIKMSSESLISGEARTFASITGLSACHTYHGQKTEDMLNCSHACKVVYKNISAEI